MFGKLLRIDENNLTYENKSEGSLAHLMNCHVVFDEADRKIVGEIVKINEKEIEVLLIGEIKDNRFLPGAIKKPTTTPRIINIGELELIIGSQRVDKGLVTIGESAIYKNYKINASINELFANHLSIIGNTGSGKSCAISKILQNIFYSENKPVNSHFVLFDAYGEYKNAFNDMNKVGLGFKKINSVFEEGDDELLKIPLSFLEVDDLAILLSVTDADQLTVLEKALKLVYIFTSTDARVTEYKNNIIAQCLLDILTSGKTSTQIRDQIIAVLTHYNTEDLSLESSINQVGYNRTLSQCLLIDDQGKMNAISLVTDFIKGFIKLTLDEIVVDKTSVYTLDDLYYALEFALISEGTLNNSRSYDKNSILKNRLQTIMNSNYRTIFDVKEYMSKETYVKKFFSFNDKPVQLVDINLNHLDDKYAKIVTKLLTKLFFNYTTSLENRGTYPINIVLEEAHRYVQNDTDTDVIGYNIFDRITKEGRKYGCFLTFITQRPSELSSTALSQCSNFIVFRLFYPKDFEMVKSISTNVTIEAINKIKTLNSGCALSFGTGFKIPLLVSFELPSPMPESSSLKLDDLWY